MLGEEPPADDEGMTAFAETLAAPQIADLLRTAQPESPPATMRFPASVRRRYERLRRFPAGYGAPSVAAAKRSARPLAAALDVVHRPVDPLLGDRVRRCRAPGRRG